MTIQICPACQSENTYFSKKRQLQVCEDCEHGWEPATTALPAPAPGTALKLFLSYGHDTNEELVRRVKADLEKRGHDVWFDKNEIKAGDDWRRAITEGIVSSNRVLSFLSKHSTRDPGVCLDEIAIAIGAKGGNIQTILVESQDEVNPPSTISHIQWLDMHDWKDGHGAVQIAKGEPAKGDEAWEAWYQERFAEIVRVVESPENVRFAGEIEKLKGFLKPISSEARIFQLLNKDFVGRQWLVKAVEEWRTTDNPSRLFWITGSPGVGKSAFSAFLAHQEKHKIVAVQFCEYDKPDHRNPVRIVCTLAFQLATRLPDYRKLLMDLPELDKLSEKSESELFSYLLANPLKHVIHGGRERCLILIDALDEASEGSRNPLVELLARHADALPEWLGIVVTSRPETSVTGPLSMYNPLVLDTGTQANHSDLAEYLKLKLASQLAGRTDTDSIVDHIITQSEGVFLYAEWVCRDIVDRNLSLDRLDQFPKGLGGIFRQFFARQFPDQTVYEQTIEPALGAILAAREPLPIEILQELFGWRETELRKWLRILGALFPVVQESGIDVIKPWHKSVPDWLSDPNQSLEYFVEVREGCYRLAEYGLKKFNECISTLHPYFIAHLPWLLSIVDEVNLEKLLWDYAFIRAKTEVGMVRDLLEDYGRIKYKYRDVGLIEDTIRLSSHILSVDIKQLPSQLYGRLADRKEAKIIEMLKKVVETTEYPWLKPTSVCFMPPGGALLVTLTGHDGDVNGVSITPDGSYAVSASSDNTLKVWEIETGKELRTLTGHDGGVNGVSITPDGSYAVSASSDNTLKVWEIETGKELRTLTGHDGGVNGVSITPDGSYAVSASSDNTLKVWEIETGKELRTLTGHDGGVNGVSITLDGRHVISSSQDRIVNIWDLETGEKLKSLTVDSSSINCVSITPDGKRAVSGSSNTLKVWDLETGVELKALASHSGRVNGVSITPDGKRAVFGFLNTLKVWDLETGKELRTIAGHNGWLKGISITPDGRKAVSLAWDKTLKIWDLERGNDKKQCNPNTGVIIMPDGKRAVSGSSNTLKVWDLETGEEMHNMAEHCLYLKVVSITPDGRMAVSVSKDNTMKVWNLETGQVLNTITGHDGEVNRVCISSDGMKAVSVSNDGTMKLWDLIAGELLQVYMGHSNLHVTGVSMSPDGKRAITSSEDKSLKLWDLEGGYELETLIDVGSSVKEVCITPDCKRVISASMDNSLKVWDLKTGKELQSLIGHRDRVRKFSVTADGMKVVSASDDRTLKVWNLGTGKELKTLNGHRDKVKGVRVSSDGEVAISVSDDKTLKVWDLNLGMEIISFISDAPFTFYSITADGRRIIAGDTGNTVHTFELMNV